MELDLKPGTVVIQGENGQGKSNLLEAVYILAIAKSPRTSNDRELIRRQSTHESNYSRVAAVIRRDADDLRLQLDFHSSPKPEEDTREPAPDALPKTTPEGLSVQRRVRVNGVPRRASELVGQLTAVMFSAHDLELVYGSPTLRRRYLDILISQLERRYLGALQRYQRVVSQRNHLLKAVRDGRSRIDELVFWDDKLVSEATYVMARRLHTVRRLSELARPTHGELVGNDERLELLYRPSISMSGEDSEEKLAQDLREAIEGERRREIAQGMTVLGPHRDDLQLLIDGMDAGVYASRGQSRTAVLAMRLAEAEHLRDQRRQQPVVMLDDVLSELDPARREHVLEMASRYEQCFITTSDVESIPERFLSGATRLAVHDGAVETVGASFGPMA